MRYLPNVCALAILSACALAAGAKAQEDGAPPDGLLILRNGGVLEGTVTKTGDYYLLTRGDDSEVRLPASDVEFACRDFEDAYAHQRDRLKPDSLREHVELAQWCLRHNLTARAADQLLAAWVIEPGHPAVRAVERRLEHIRAAEKRVESAPPKAAAAGYVSLTEIEETLATLPPEAVERFTVEIQPVLLNRCGAATCHGQASTSEFLLDRPTGRGTMTRRFTQRNLYSTLKQLDRQAPKNSPLLTTPAAIHGGGAEPVLGPADAQITRQLAEWVKLAAAAPAIVGDGPPLSIRRAQGALLQTADEPGDRDVALAGAESSSPEDKSAAHAIFEEESPDGFRPRDEFDPEIFNRRYRGGERTD